MSGPRRRGGGSGRGEAGAGAVARPPEAAPRRLWAWLAGTGYRPERHYMRGGTTEGARAAAVPG
jgi:hypothetical protein